MVPINTMSNALPLKTNVDAGNVSKVLYYNAIISVDTKQINKKISTTENITIFPYIINKYFQNMI